MTRPRVRAEPFGTTADGTAVQRYDLVGADGAGASVLDFGCVVLEVRAPDREGRLTNVVLGHRDLRGYERDQGYLGALAGRVANRIAGASFELDGRAHALPANGGDHHLHGGPGGFHARSWEARVDPDAAPDEAALLLHRVSPAGEEGYPGALDVTVRIAWSETHELRIALRAVTDAPTLVNPAHHGYWNLAGEGAGDVSGHELTVHADAYLPVDAAQIPTGERASVAGTPLDLRSLRRLGEVLAGAHPQLRLAGGLDHAFVLRGAPGDAGRPGPSGEAAGEGTADGAATGSTPAEAAVLVDPESGRTLRVRTDRPSLQVYTGNALDGRIVGRSGRPYGRHAGVALEAQGFPDAPHHPGFPQVVLRPGEVFRSETIFALGVRPA